jgi:hypothetical protein
LKEVIIESPDDFLYIFRCGQWLDLKEGDGKIERSLQPTLVEKIKKERSHSRESNHSRESSRSEDLGSSRSRDSSHDSHRSPRNDDYFMDERRRSSPRDEPKKPYIIKVDTTDRDNAETDAQVYLQITGNVGKTERILLARSISNRVPFLRGQSDIFELNVPDVGEIKRIR